MPSFASAITLRCLSRPDLDGSSQDSTAPSVTGIEKGPFGATETALPSSGPHSESLPWEKDRRNPGNWSNLRKSWIFLILMLDILNSCLGSSVHSNAVGFIAKEFHVTSQAQKVLPMSVYLIGYAFGPILWAPMSEQIGRRNIVLATFVVFSIFTMACALSPNWPGFLIFRLLTGAFASAPIAVVTGILADMYQNHRSRGRAVALYMVVSVILILGLRGESNRIEKRRTKTANLNQITAFGPLIGPILSGFASPTLGWRWSWWISLMVAGATLVPLLSLPETHRGVLLKRYKIHVDQGSLPPQRMEGRGFMNSPKLRPIYMLLFEPIVTASSLYLALVYSIFYMSFQSFPIIFQGVYEMSLGISSLTYIPIGIGSLIFLPIFWLYDDYFIVPRQNSGKPLKEEYLRLPLACLGGPLFAASLFWLGWSARKDVSFVAPMLAGIPFGFGFICIFIALMNYMTDAYKTYAASANAASSCSRSLCATVLPFATHPLFDHLGVAGACSLLGGLSVVMCVIPFVFIWKGDQIRAKSHFCNMLKQ
ncbi:hypothetical protein P175DRAFT_0553276 [Aspergillus ochraceoroseus IBT 24754]|uniref:Major facilitator superfamily (MFS) profile domain-containing protein n=3 Tax=Aspergillus subgen. Nidulantes TaxID=2720870 RepID=A0A0F8VS84_9EURO|nr:uncharacterized protein P175DRAFT_0553276 [Aspergillus ochraceoroseus IBT 24754]KKK20387.1 hypothetical protein AOCH_005225 [Aspergillus ochraceoroseus]KKK26076.1 hypothetical protein ARAM_005915 [Aspergillus rambellii]PTU23984.1 hypothetical protein P175DRAFT_0553276 [Aspergillus ochraceoroseus IBT 24754]